MEHSPSKKVQQLSANVAPQGSGKLLQEPNLSSAMRYNPLNCRVSSSTGRVRLPAIRAEFRQKRQAPTQGWPTETGCV